MTLPRDAWTDILSRLDMLNKLIEEVRDIASYERALERKERQDQLLKQKETENA